MILYHGSLEIVEKPEIRQSNRKLDYGDGFYTTSSYKQALAWVKRRLLEEKRSIGFVNLYHFEEEKLPDFNSLIFDEPTEEWVDFVMKNRMQIEFTHKYDIVYGPVANDKVYASFALYEGGIISKQMLIAELKTYNLVDQYLFHTKEALSELKFLEVKEVKL